MHDRPIITLFGGGEGFGLPEISPYAMKTEIHLQMAGLPYRKEVAHPDQGPKGQLPFVDFDGVVVADSTFIRNHIEAVFHVDLDRGLDTRQRAEAWAIERMIENHFAWAVIGQRYGDDANFAKGPAHWFDAAPESLRDGLRAKLRARMLGNVQAVGIGRHDADEIHALGMRSLHALSALLGEKDYLMGDAPTSVDAIAFALLAGLVAPYFDSRLRRAAERDAALLAYTDRMMARFYPRFAWRRALAA